MSILSDINAVNLVGRGGACFPVAAKWQMVKDAAGEKKYVVANCSEGEPGVKKDGYIIENCADIFISGMMEAIRELRAVKGYIYINPEYYKIYQSKLRKIIGKQPIEIFKKNDKAGYIGGEETSLLNAMEGKRIEPRLRPPFPPTCGLWNFPTLINNVETFYNVGLLARNKYEHERFYTIDGDCLNAGVYEYPEEWTIKRVLMKSGNYPSFPFFVQSGGDGSGEVLNGEQLDRPVGGAGSIAVYSFLKNNDPMKFMRRVVDFFTHESCGQCTPCREGTYRLKEILSSPKPDWDLFGEILENLDDTAFCGLGGAVSLPFRSYIKNVLADDKVKMDADDKKIICDCFSSASV